MGSLFVPSALTAAQATQLTNAAKSLQLDGSAITNPAFKDSFADIFAMIMDQSILGNSPGGQAITADSLLDRIVKMLATVNPANTYFDMDYSSAPLANAILSDSGQLAAGSYEVIAAASTLAGGNSGAQYSVQYRNATNAANNKQYALCMDAVSVAAWTAPYGLVHFYQTIALNERFRIANDNATAGGSRISRMLLVRPAA